MLISKVCFLTQLAADEWIFVSEKNCWNFNLHVSHFNGHTRMLSAAFILRPYFFLKAAVCFTNPSNLFIGVHFTDEPRYEKTDFLHMRKQRRKSASRSISAFVFATWIVKFLYFLNAKFQASCHYQWLHSQVCVRAGRKPRRPVFSQRGSDYSTCDTSVSCHNKTACFAGPQVYLIALEFSWQLYNRDNGYSFNPDFYHFFLRILEQIV